MTENETAKVDRYIEEKLLRAADAPRRALVRNAAEGLPAIDVSPAQGKLLHLLVKLTGARRVLEIGTLGGYSTLWMARALGEGGRIVSLEFEPRHARVARANLTEAGSTNGSRFASAAPWIFFRVSRPTDWALSTWCSSTPTRPTTCLM